MPATLSIFFFIKGFFSSKNLEINYYLLERERERERDAHLASYRHNYIKNNKLASLLTILFRTIHCRRIAFTAILHALLYRIERPWRPMLYPCCQGAISASLDFEDACY